MENYFGLTAGILGVIAALPYIRNSYLRITRPHRFAWFIFLVISIISFAGQLSLGAKASLFFAGWFIVNNIIIFILSLRKNAGYGGVTTMNILGLLLAGVGIALWWILSSPLAALISILIAEVIGVAMIIVKSYKHPESETLSMWAIAIVASALNILAVGKWDPALLLFPVYLFIGDTAIVSAILIGRQINNRDVSSTK